MNIAPSSQMLFDVAVQRGLTPRWLTEYGVFVVEIDGKQIPFYMTYSNVNSQLFSRITHDKYACRQWLAQSDFPNIPYCFTTQRSEVNKFLDEHKALIAKPVLGERAIGVKKILDHTDIANYDLSTTIFEKYILGDEYRILLLNGEVLGVQRRELNPQTKHPWRKKRINLQKNDFSEEMIFLSQQVQEKIPQSVLAIDWLVDEQGVHWILEVNSAPGLWSFAHPHEGEPQNFSEILFEFFLRSVK